MRRDSTESKTKKGKKKEKNFIKRDRAFIMQGEITWKKGKGNTGATQDCGDY